MYCIILFLMLALYLAVVEHVVVRTLPPPVALVVGVALVLQQAANLVTRPTVETHWPMKTRTRRRGVCQLVGINWNNLLFSIPTLVFVYCVALKVTLVEREVYYTKIFKWIFLLFWRGLMWNELVCILLYQLQ